MQKRMEKDSLGELEIPAEVYWGIHTQRAINNFDLSRRRVPACLIQALALVKRAACLTNLELGFIDKYSADAIVQASVEIAEGKWSESFPLDALQGGAGTSLNMNMNEVLANRALEIRGHAKGSYDIIHPIQTVNKHQSTNDVYPTALRIAAIYLLRELSAQIALSQGAFQTKEKEFQSIVKVGRTELQEAVPMTLGAEFSGFAEALSRDRWRTFKCEERLRVTNMGSTAVGTGLSAPKSYIFLVIEKLREVTGLGLSRADHVPAETAFADNFAEVSGILMAHAVNLIKISNDLRLLNLLGEIRLPSVQAGSSIMPGKVNPVLLESLIQACEEIKASHGVILNAVSHGTLQINEFLPQVALHLLTSLEMMVRMNQTLTAHIQGITANVSVCREYLEKSPVLVTALLPYIGYEKAGELFKAFETSGQTRIREFLNQQLGQAFMDKILSPESLTQLGYRDEHAKNA